ncbi:two-component sensor histidine kinase bacteria, putative [Ricinus communis]|uniref:Two-component sensor histidine kinase bacteria, putative n=1 Tax=Ricinus communis TaxID=3988 RepID=B9TQE7_RICCO|nr:two-component sensor histidine kinase bacteria, putative [Ricinus communis]
MGDIDDARVLLIDDDADTCTVTAEILGLSGCVVRRSSSGAQGIAEAYAFRPEVVLIDIGMPDIDGFTVATRIRSLPEIRQPILIAYTGYQCCTFRLAAERSGFDSMLQKPATIEALVGLIAALRTGARGRVPPAKIAAPMCRSQHDA